MEIIYLKEVDSTHRFLKDHLKQNSYKEPILVYTQNQTNGIGSRDNKWKGKEGNLFFSFAIDKKLLAKDIPFQSYSIYFSYILKEVLKSHGSNVWIKWPNDFYIDDHKIGGTITNLSGELILCGIGLNLEPVSQEFEWCLDIEIDTNLVLNGYIENLKKTISWKEIFSKYLIEFELSKNFTTTINKQKNSLRDAVLNNDGSIQLNGRRVFNAR